jgi:hypothetical protein
VEARVELNVTGNWRGKGQQVSPVERFESKLLPQEDGCIYFDARCDKDGYPQFSVDGRSIRAARFIFPYATGEDISAEDFVCHTCDEPRCVNVAHLWKGTALLNNQDRARKGRSAKSTPGSGFGARR